jgi:hypothetical protein
MKLYRLLLRLYPRRHRDLFGAEMEEVFERAYRDHRNEGWLAQLPFVSKEVAGLIAGMAGAWLSECRGHAHIEPALVVPVSAPNEIPETERLIQRSIDLMVDAIANHRFPEARFYSEIERGLRRHLERLRGSEPE